MSGDIGCAPAETALLGCLLHMTAETARPYLDQFVDEDLVDPRHRIVLEAIRNLVGSDPPVDPDPVVVLGELRRTGKDTSFLADQAAGVTLLNLAAAAPVVASTGHYARIVLEHAWRRRVEEAGVRLQQLAGSSPLEDLAQHVLSELQAAVHEAQRRLPAAGT